VKIVFITASPNAACSVFYWNAFKSMDCITFYEPSLDLRSFDVALVMTYDHERVKHIKHQFPNLKIGIIDPRSHRVYESTLCSDFLVVDSIEMEDYWRISQKPIFRYIEYPDVSFVQKVHKKKDKISIGYHGNQIHLMCMSETVTVALSELGKKYNLELLIMHSGSSPGGNEAWYPKNISVQHIPWDMDNYIKKLGHCDIGIVPNNLLNNENAKRTSETNNNFNYAPDDYLLRFKMPSNPGRFVIFGILGIPVVADFYPSALQYLKNKTGFVANSSAGWYYSLEQLIKSYELRQEMGNALQDLVRKEFNFDLQNKKLTLFLKEILQ